jgi:hypothetical protein
MPVNFGKAIQTTSLFGTLWRFIWSYKVYLVVLLFILINVVIVDVQAGKPENIVNDAVPRLVNPLSELQSISLTIIDNGGFVNPDVGFFGNSWNVIKLIWSLLFTIYALFLWIKLFSWLSLKFIMWDDSKDSSGYLNGLIIYFLLQMIYFASNGQSVFTSIYALIDFFKALPYMIKPVANLGEGYENVKNAIHGVFS